MTVAVDLAGLEAAVQHALITRDERALHVLGYGEISSVLAWPEADGPWACKRLPVFDRPARYEEYRSVFEEYVSTLESSGVAMHETRLEALPSNDGHTVAYCVQPALDPHDLAPSLLRDATAAEATELLGTMLGHIATVVTPAVGLDAHCSNWARQGNRLVYFDVTTPLLREADGSDRLDTELFLASLPATLRPVVRRFLLAQILDPYFAPRSSALDLLANLHRDNLGHWIPLGVALANERLDTDLSVDEARGHYRQDARLWRGLQQLRRLDRVWQRQVRRRPYPLLLPGRIARPRVTR